MIDFLPIQDDDFTFSSLFQNYEEGHTDTTEFGMYPFFRLRYFFLDKKSLPIMTLKIDEEKIENFDMFRNIFIRGDYFYLIAYHYFINIKEYEFEYKVEGRMKIADKNGELKTISFFEPLYNALIDEKIKSQKLLRHEYIVSKNKYLYINKLTEILFNDYYDLDDAIRKEKNVFAKYGMAVKEVYLEVFRDFYSNFVDYLTTENFEDLKKLVYPSKKEVQSFRFAPRKTYRNLKDMEARTKIVESIKQNLIEKGFISKITTFEQVYDLFDNKRRELPKILWEKDITSLATFYKIMEDDKIIQDAEGEHWKILADYFILKNNSEISREELKSKKKSTNFKILTDLESTFDLLKKIIA
ncbi:hypothetical protein MTQ00_09510 [Chryseobacterium sp. B21-037]|jgi:hypothetical protein|uniref:hypothetical protein n=1 Tax=Chryseobacterium sp. B21-037 TaxID=2926038 RepID=UPI00235A451B|nr:hypothetical protein [Chryseobacterium sp. B21-037]MDC8104777.1 hypothetical protein [Chryseobacterium sp. B21-037]